MRFVLYLITAHSTPYREKPKHNENVIQSRDVHD